jgi:hypothetical protein
MSNKYYTRGLPVGGTSEFPSVPVSLTDHGGRSPYNTIFGESVMGMRVDDISVQFQYNNSTRDVNTITNGTGATSNALSMAAVETGTGVGDSSLTSVDSLRYRPGHQTQCHFTTLYDVPEAVVNQKHGLFNGADGVYFGYEGLAFGVFLLEGSSETFIPQTSWNKDKLDGTGPSDEILDPQDLNIYGLGFGWLGIAPITYEVLLGGKWITVHVIDQTNSQDEPHLQNPSLPLQAFIERTSGTGTSKKVRTSSWRAGVVAGQDESNASNRWFSADVLTFSPTASVEVPILTLRSNSTFQSKTNHVKSELGVIRFVVDGNKSVAFRGTLNGSLTGDVFGAVDANNSVNSLDTTATAITGGSKGPATVLGKVGEERANVLGTGIVWYPGQDFTVTVEAAAAFTGTVSVAVRWIEYF